MTPEDVQAKFLSTPSARRATAANAEILVVDDVFLSTPSARRATLRSSLITHSTVTISIHALREEGD